MTTIKEKSNLSCKNQSKIFKETIRKKRKAIKDQKRIRPEETQISLEIKNN